MAADRLDLGTLEVIGKRFPRLEGARANTVKIIDSRQITEGRYRDVQEVLDDKLDITVHRSGIAALSGLSVRGVSGGTANNKVRVLVDGVPVSTLRRGFVLESIDISAVERIELIKGPASSVYGGGALAGTLNIVSKIPSRRLLKLEGAYGSFNTKKYGFYYEDRKDGFAYRFDLGYIDTDGHLEDLGNNEKVNPARVLNSGFYGSCGTGYGSVSFSVRGFDSDRDEPNFSNMDGSYLGNEEDIRQTLRSFTAGWQDSIHAGDLSFRLFRNSNNEKSEVMDEEKAVAEGFVTEANLNLAGGMKLLTGADYEKQGLDQTGAGKEFEQKIFAPFGQLTVPLFDSNVELSGSARYEMNSEFDETVSPSVGAVYKISQRLKARVSISDGYRMPTVEELYSTNIRKFGNPDLDPEKALNYETGLGYATEKVEANITVYKMLISDLIVSQLPEDAEYYNGAKIQKKLKNISGEKPYAGFEVDALYRPLENLDLSAGYSYLDPGDLTFHTDRHRLKGSAGYRYRRHDIGVSCEYAAGRYLWDDKSGKRDDYLLVHCRYAIEVAKSLSAYVRVNNITDEEYYVYFYDPMPGRNVMVGLNLVY